MTIETKYNIGDEVWVNDCDELVKCEIIGIRYELDSCGEWIMYSLKHDPKLQYLRYEEDLIKLDEPIEDWHDHCAKIAKLCREFNEM